MTWNTDLYDSIAQDVMTLTGRPDLADETAVAIRTATTSVHSRAAFPRDLRSDLVKLPNASFQSQLDIQVLLPRFRGVSTIRIVDTQFSPVESPEIEIVEPDDIYDPVYRSVRNNIAYVAGTSINIRTALAASGYMIEWYQMPATRREDYNSWIAQIQPDPIVYMAAALVFTTNGNDEKAASYTRIVDRQLFPELLSNFVTSKMR